MEDKVDKNIEKLIEKAMRSSSLEVPSFNFTAKVMSRVTARYNAEVVVYKPLISKAAWGIIAISVLALVIYAFFGTDSTGTGWLSKLDFGVLSDIKVPNPLSEFKISKTFTYAILLFGVMLCIQIPILNNHFNQRFQN